MTDVKAQLDRIEKMLVASHKNILTVEDVCVLTGLSKARIYALCSERRIPHYKQGKLYFKRSEVEAWMTAHRVSTVAEVKSEAAMYCHTHPR